jgi:superfamily II DNA/RNA helicase
MNSDQAAIYEAVSTAAESLINRELTRENPDIGVISAALWWTRFAATVPNADGAIHYARACGIDIEDTNDLDAGQRAEVIAELQKDDMLVAGSWAKLDKAMELIRAFAQQGDKVIVFTGLKAMYKAVLAACKERGIGVTGLDGTTTQARNGVCRMFEADPAKTVLLAGTGMLNRGVTVNGANHVIILDLDWNPETTRQAEDRCHRPGQTKDVTVHYILTADTSDEQMWKVVTAKARAQRQVLDHEMIYQSTADLLHSAASAQLQVARALLSKKRSAHHHSGVELIEVSGGEGSNTVPVPVVIDVPGSAVTLMQPQQSLAAKAPGNVVTLSLPPILPVEAETVWGEDHEAQASRLVFGQISLSLSIMTRARRKKAIPEAQMTLL